MKSDSIDWERGRPGTFIQGIIANGAWRMEELAIRIRRDPDFASSLLVVEEKTTNMLDHHQSTDGRRNSPEEINLLSTLAERDLIGVPIMKQVD